MQKVKEELFLSLIFVAKWLALGLGSLGIIYLAINLAYHKSYFDPRMATYDLEIQEQQEIISGLQTTQSTLDRELASIEEKLAGLSEELSLADARIESAKVNIESLGLQWWEKIPVPMLEKDKKVEDAYKTLEEAKNAKSAIASRIKVLNEQGDESRKILSATTEKVLNHNSEILSIKQNKKKAEVDVKGPLLWLLGVLGLT